MCWQHPINPSIGKHALIVSRCGLSSRLYVHFQVELRVKFFGGFAMATCEDATEQHLSSLVKNICESDITSTIDLLESKLYSHSGFIKFLSHVDQVTESVLNDLSTFDAIHCYFKIRDFRRKCQNVEASLLSRLDDELNCPKCGDSLTSRCEGNFKEILERHEHSELQELTSENS